MSLISLPVSFRLCASALALSFLSISPVRAAEGDEPSGKEASAAQPGAQAPAEKPANQVESSVVKIFATQRLPDFLKPWTKMQPRDITGSGVVIEGKRILTNAHVVQYATEIQVQANQSGNKISAKVLAIDLGVDLALLKLEDETFFDAQKPLPLGGAMPSVKDSVMVYGFPTGGSSLSITKGIVSRIEFASINYGTSALRVQIDAAINPGNSGGPAVVDDKLVGVAFSKLGNAQNIGYIIPCDEIRLFLGNVDAGKPLEKGALHDEYQTLSNQALRDYLKLAKSIEGVVLNRIDSVAPDYPLKKWDVVTRIGSTAIDNEGKIKAGENLRLDFRYLLQKECKDGKIELTVLREGKELVVSVPFEYRRPRLIPFLVGQYPRYFIYGPVVFSSASEEFLSLVTGGNVAAMAYGVLSATNSPLLLRRGERPTADLEEIVVVPAPFFPHKITKGYGKPVMRVVSSVNDVPVKSLRHLVQLLRDAKGDFVKIEFAGRGAETLVFPRKEVLASTDEILNDNGIRTQGSPDLMKVWADQP